MLTLNNATMLIKSALSKYKYPYYYRILWQKYSYQSAKE